MVELEKVKEESKDLGNVKHKSVTLRSKNKKLLTYKQIRNFTEKIKKTLPPNAKVVVRALNMERFTTLHSSYGIRWRTDEEEDDYLEDEAKEVDGFKHFYNFTIDVDY
jgi:S-adenosylmethionine:diacylglycerol 3-amino-3-carboxypropyl transferase